MVEFDIFNFIIANLPLIAGGIGLLIFIIWLITKAFPFQKQFKYLEMTKAVHDDLDSLYKNFSERMGKSVYLGITRVGFVLGFTNLLWNKKVKIKDNISINNVKEVAEATNEIKKNSQMNKFKEITTPMKILKICSNRFPAKQLAMLFGFGTKYLIVDNSLLSDSEYGLVIDSQSQPSMFYGITIFSRSARAFIENVSFRINRENELQEFANQIPKMAFFENRLANIVARMREQALIEKEKYKSQMEAAEE
jgi:hypothetical protein